MGYIAIAPYMYTLRGTRFAHTSNLVHEENRFDEFF